MGPGRFGDGLLSRYRLCFGHLRHARPIPSLTPRRNEPGAIAISDLIQIIYSSQPFGFDEAMLSGILLDARRCNTRDGITGALVCRRDI